MRRVFFFRNLYIKNKYMKRTKSIKWAKYNTEEIILLKSVYVIGSSEPSEGFCLMALGQTPLCARLFTRTAKSRAPAGGNNYPENGLVKPPRRDTRALSPAGMFGGKVPLRFAAQKSRPHAPSVPMRSAPAYFLC